MITPEAPTGASAFAPRVSLLLSGYFFVVGYFFIPDVKTSWFWRLLHGTPQTDRFRGFFSDPEVEEFDPDRKGHGKVNVPFWDMYSQTVGEEGEADQQEEAEGQHFYRRVSIDENSDRFGGRHHDQDRQNDGGNHDTEVSCQSDRRNDRIEGKYDVDQSNLEH